MNIPQHFDLGPIQLHNNRNSPTEWRSTIHRFLHKCVSARPSRMARSLFLQHHHKQVKRENESRQRKEETHLIGVESQSIGFGLSNVANRQVTVTESQRMESARDCSSERAAHPQTRIRLPSHGPTIIIGKVECDCTCAKPPCRRSIRFELAPVTFHCSG